MPWLGDLKQVEVNGNIGTQQVGMRLGRLQVLLCASPSLGKGICFCRLQREVRLAKRLAPEAPAAPLGLTG